MITKTISVNATILNLPNKPLRPGYLVARHDLTLGKPELWYYGLYESIERAQQVAYEIRNGVVLEIGESRMTNQEAIKIIEDECEHIKSHLKCKGKAEDFYKELGDMCIAFYMAINALSAIEEIKKDINEIIYECDNSYHTNAHFTLALDGLLEKIDKHLKGENG